jgi:hypothetical protein
MRQCAAMPPEQATVRFGVVDDPNFESAVNFPFVNNAFPEDLDCVVARAVLSGERPIRYVAHTSDNDWWVSDGVTNADDADAHVVSHIRHVLDLDRAVEELASLPLGREATRDAVGDEWQVGPFAWADDG